MAKKEVPPDFEKNLERLESIVTALERGELPLERSVELFKEGRALAHMLEKRLTVIEEEIRIVIEEPGGAARTVSTTLQKLDGGS